MPTIRNILDSHITENMTDYEKELVLHDYLVTHCKYSKDTQQNSESDISFPELTEHSDKDM